MREIIGTHSLHKMSFFKTTTIKLCRDEEGGNRVKEMPAQSGSYSTHCACTL